MRLAHFTVTNYIKQPTTTTLENFATKHSLTRLTITYKHKV